MSMIKLFKTPFGCFVYDAYINRMGKVSEYAYSVIKHNNNDEMRACSEIQSMINDGFFRDYNHSFHFPEREVLDTMCHRALQGIILQVTQNCNLRCSYCAYTENSGNERLHSNKRMSLDTAIAAVDFLHNCSIDSNTISIGFYGGEPLLEFRLVKDVMEYAKQKFKGKEIVFPFTTNATLLTEDVLDYLNENNVSLLISLDGPEKVNDINRIFASKNAGSYKAVANALGLIEAKYPRLKLNTRINMVMDPSLDYNDYFQIFDDSSITSSFPVRSQLVDSTDLKKTFSASDDFITNIQYFNFFNELWANSKVDISNYHALLFNDGKWNVNERYKPFLLGPITSVSLPSRLCLPGITRLLIDAEGQFFPCEKTSEIFDILNIGNIKEGINVDKCLSLIKMPRITEQECKSCFAFHVCNSCYISACNKDGFDREKRLNKCNVMKQSAAELLERYIIKNRNSIRKYV